MEDPTLTALLSQALVAYTIEFDNEFERRMPHRTTTQRGSSGPWLTSLAMWANCMRFLGDGGLTVAELTRRARTPTNLDGMRRWGYITIDGRGRGKGAQRVRAGALLCPTRAGLRARETWQPLGALIERRWRERFGASAIERLRAALEPFAGDGTLPDCLPILGYGLFSEVGDFSADPQVGPASELPLWALLSRALLACAIEYEHGRELALAVGANVLRVLDDRGVPLRALPGATGVSKEAVGMALGFLAHRSLARVEPDPAGSRFRRVRLTPAGVAAQTEHTRRLAEIEGRWPSRDALRDALADTVGDRERLALGLEPYPDGWRASVGRPARLPHFPMVLHRGGFPDGS